MSWFDRSRLPPHWEFVTMGDVATVVGGSTPKSKQAEYWDGDILCMSGGSRAHGTISSNVHLALALSVRGGRVQGLYRRRAYLDADTAALPLPGRERRVW